MNAVIGCGLWAIGDCHWRSRNIPCQRSGGTFAKLERILPVAAVVNAVTILRHLAAHPGQGVNAIARATGLSPSTCFGILKTLVDEHFVELDPDSKFYRLGAAPARLFQVDQRLNEWTRCKRKSTRLNHNQ